MNRLSSLASSDSLPKTAPPKKISSLKLHREEALHDASRGLVESCEDSVPSLLGKKNRETIGRARSFFVPVRYEPKYRYPLIVWLHNDGFNENQLGYVIPHISTQNYVGVGIRGSKAIDAAGQRFVWADTPAAISRCEDAVWQAIDEASERYSIHRDRIFIAGYGEGGTMARRIAFQRSNQFAGCISLGGQMPRGASVFSNLSKARELRNFWAVGMQSSSFSELQFDDDVRLAADARLKFDIRKYTTDDEMVTEVLRDVNAWVMKIVSGEAEQPSTKHDWTTVPVQFSPN